MKKIDGKQLKLSKKYKFTAKDDRIIIKAVKDAWKISDLISNLLYFDSKRHSRLENLLRNYSVNNLEKLDNFLAIIVGIDHEDDKTVVKTLINFSGLNNRLKIICFYLLILKN